MTEKDLKGILWSDRSVICTDYGGVYVSVFICPNVSHFHLKCAHFVVCKLSITKKEKKDNVAFSECTRRWR